MTNPDTITVTELLDWAAMRENALRQEADTLLKYAEQSQLRNRASALLVFIDTANELLREMK